MSQISLFPVNESDYIRLVNFQTKFAKPNLIESATKRHEPLSCLYQYRVIALRCSIPMLVEHPKFMMTNLRIQMICNKSQLIYRIFIWTQQPNLDIPIKQPLIMARSCLLFWTLVHDQTSINHFQHLLIVFGLSAAKIKRSASPPLNKQDPSRANGHPWQMRLIMKQKAHTPPFARFARQWFLRHFRLRFSHMMVLSRTYYKVFPDGSEICWLVIAANSVRKQGI